MDRRVFQPRPDGSAERRRNAISMSLVILVAGGLWLFYLRSHLNVRPVLKNQISIPAAGARKEATQP